jgi:hypothetical protein
MGTCFHAFAGISVSRSTLISALLGISPPSLGTHECAVISASSALDARAGELPLWNAMPGVIAGQAEVTRATGLDVDVVVSDLRARLVYHDPG